MRVRLQESEHKLGLSMPIELAKERITQLEAEATSLERYYFLTLQLLRDNFRLKLSVVYFVLVSLCEDFVSGFVLPCDHVNVQMFTN